jgi:hypothetical protein
MYEQLLHTHRDVPVFCDDVCRQADVRSTTTRTQGCTSPARVNTAIGIHKLVKTESSLKLFKYESPIYSSALFLVQ